MKKNKLILFDWGNIVEDGNSLNKCWNVIFKELELIKEKCIEFLDR